MPYLAMWIVSMIGSVVVDHIIEKEMFFSRTGIRKISNTIATFGPAMALLGRTYNFLLLLQETCRSLICWSQSYCSNGLADSGSWLQWLHLRRGAKRHAGYCQQLCWHSYGGHQCPGQHNGICSSNDCWIHYQRSQ